MNDAATASPASDPEITLVVAAADNDVIGHDGGMPWHLGADLRRFKQMTMGKPVVMGRKTFDSIGKPLSGRHNIIITRQAKASDNPSLSFVTSLDDALMAAADGPADDRHDIMVIGGAQIFAMTLDRARRIELTRIHLSPPGDTFFPTPDPQLWKLVATESHPAVGDAPAHSFLSYIRLSR